MVTCARCDGAPIADRLVCDRCADKALSAHYEIPALAAQLDPYSEAAGDPDAPHLHTKMDTGPALVNLDVVALLDPRTTWDGEPTSPRYWPSAIAEWDRWAADLLRLDRKPGTLRTWWDILLGVEEIGDIVGEILGLHALLVRAVGRPKRREGAPAHVGKCRQCGGQLVAGEDLIPECRSCEERVTSVTVAEAARMLDCTTRTISRTIAAGQMVRGDKYGTVDLASLLKWRRCRLG